MNAEVQNFRERRAAQKGIPLGEMVNGLLKQEIQIIESVKPVLRPAPAPILADGGSTLRRLSRRFEAVA